jgi:predicted nucleotidyltransferase
MALQLEEKDLKIAKKLLKMELEGTNSKVYVFGSRAEGTAQKFSDLDLAIDFNGQKMPEGIKFELENFFEASNISMRVDIVDLNAISENFKKIISPGLQEFFIA